MSQLPLPPAMRSFVEASDQYSVQCEYDKAMRERATTLTPFSRLRLPDISTGADLSSSVTMQLQKLNVRDGFAHMQRLREALNALSRKRGKATSQGLPGLHGLGQGVTNGQLWKMERVTNCGMRTCIGSAPFTTPS